MAHSSKKDFYIGFALYSFLKANKDARPILIESIEDAASFVMTTNTSKDFNIYIKYTQGIRRKNETSKSWNIQLTDKDKDRIHSLLLTDKPFFLFLVLGNEDSSSEIAILNSDEYNQIRLKTGITVKTNGVRTHFFEIMDGKKVALRIERNRIEKKFICNISEHKELDKLDMVINDIVRNTPQKKQFSLIDIIEKM